MIRNALLAATLLIASATPAFADTGISADRGLAQTATDGSTICLRNPASGRCSSYQSAILRTVARKTGGWDEKLSTSHLGRRQLDALVASIN